ncbi:MAG: cytochrome c3 family protein [Thermodesulfovibrionales bacterium]
MSRKLLFLFISVLYLILIASGLTLVYSVGNPEPVQKPVSAAHDNKIRIAHTEIFGKLQRPQVVFDHKKHEEAYKKEGCSTCHPVDSKNKLIFNFPKTIKGKGKKAVMKAFHDECIECHKKSGAENKKTGPVTCNNCHKKEFAMLKKPIPQAEFDFYDHNKHVKIMKEKFGKDDCGQCHHTYDVKDQKLYSKKGTEESCSSCHDLDKKRGPELAAITKVAASKGLSVRKISHQQCLNCHLECKDSYMNVGSQDVHKIHNEKIACNSCHIADDYRQAVSCTECHIPTDCSKCHTGKYRTTAELNNVARPDRGQRAISLIDIENSSMREVPFNHQSHEKSVKSCRTCHHETLKSCKACHSLTGKPEGKGINVANAYHRMLAEQSCTGCHNKMKAQKECAGCHYYISAMDVGTMNPKKNNCSSCHAGKQIAMPKPLSYAGNNIKEEVEIKVLQKEFEPSKFPHRDVLNKLVKVSNDSKLATYFHRDIQTLCNGCHHQSNTSAELQMPRCGNCHMVDYDKQNLNKTSLLSAYHRQCQGCHEKMDISKGRKCSECHEANKKGPSAITQIKNRNVVRQNTTSMLNVWHPK